MSAPDRRAKLDRDHPQLSVRRQCMMLGIARSGVYRPAHAVDDNDLKAAAADRRAVHALAVPRLSADDGDVADRGAGGQSQARSATDAAYGDRRIGSEAKDHKTRAGTHDPPVSAA